MSEPVAAGVPLRDAVLPWPSEDTRASSPDPLDAAFEDLLATRDVSVAFQPIVDLRFGDVVGYEAFARGPAGSPLASPAALFSRAAALGRTVELDWVCRATALREFADGDLPPSTSLFVNVEAATLVEACPPDLAQVVSQAEASTRVFIEINDRALAADPAGLLTAVERARRMGWGVSIDDAGASPGCLSLLSLVRADVVKLDIRAFDDGKDPTVVATVLRHVEATGATLVAKGVETPDDLRLARVIGAVYAQGHAVGEPGPIPTDRPTPPRAPVPLLRAHLLRAATSPYEVVGQRESRRMSAAEMERLADVFAARALSAGARPVILVGSGTEPYPGPDHRTSELDLLAEHAALFVVFGTRVTRDPHPGARAVVVPSRDVLANQVFVVMMTEHLAMAMVGRPDGRGQLEVVTTQDPVLVAAAAEHVILRTPPVGARSTVLPLRVVEHEEEVDEPAPPPARRGLLARLLGR